MTVQKSKTFLFQKPVFFINEISRSDDFADRNAADLQPQGKTLADRRRQRRFRGSENRKRQLPADQNGVLYSRFGNQQCE